METALAILMVMAIFIGIPMVIGFTIVGLYVKGSHRVRRAERARAVEAALATMHEAREETAATEAPAEPV